MKISTLKIYVMFGGCLCLALLILFASQRMVTAKYSSNEISLASAETKAETRCGWFSNPTPANAWLNDKDGEWLIGVQGGYQAEGDWADFKDNQWVKTNVNYGYGCACMKVTTDKKAQRILTIQSANARPLSVCRRDKKLKEPK